MSRTYRPLRMEFKQFDAAQGTFSGLGAAFGNRDYNGDIIDRGAFADTLRNLKATKARTGSRFLIPLLWMHDTSAPVGGVTDAYETADGLAIACQCDLNTTQGEAVFSGIKMGYTNGLSIGYQTVRATSDSKGVRHLTSVNLLEISVTTMGFAANPNALADSLSAKSRKDNHMARDYSIDDFKRAMFADLQASVRRAELDSIPSAPEHKDFKTDREYADAFRAWQRKTASVPMSEESVREGGKGTPREEGVGYITITKSLEEINAEIARQQDQRAMQPNASLEDVAAYVKRHGHTPDGRTVQDTSATIERAYAALERKLADAK